MSTTRRGFLRFFASAVVVATVRPAIVPTAPVLAATYPHAYRATYVNHSHWGGGVVRPELGVRTTG